MIIKSIELYNIRSHRNTKIDFDKGINVFIGGTGTGKTSILMAIEFALFGSEAIRDFSTLLNRRAGMGKVVLEFEHNGKRYKIVRGLVREGRSIKTDNSSLKIFEDGKLIFSGGRVQEMNEKIKEILGFPKWINPSNLFEILFYSKQDEIRKIIEMSKEERQVYIDNSLLLDRYRKTWENMKEIIDELKRMRDSLQSEVKFLEDYRKELEDLEKKISEKEEELEKKKEDLERIKENYRELEEKVRRVREEFGAVEKEREEALRRIERERNIREEIERIRSEIESLRSKIREVNYNEEEYKRLNLRKSEILGRISFLKSERRKIEAEMERFKKLEPGKKCPLCKQEVGREHFEEVLKEFENRKDKILQEMIVLEEELDRVNRKINEMEELRRKHEENERLKFLLRKREDELAEKERIVLEIESQRDLLTEIEERYRRLKEEKERISEEYVKISKELARVESEISRLEREISEWREKREKIIEKLREIEEKKKKLEKLDHAINRLELMREEIRKIREIVRLKFIEDFRKEFSRWFRSIRREEYYRVDITNEYEPKAYTPEGLEVPVSSLSGGERTSVALAYRLALSSIVSRLGGISKPDLIILDEPTVGLDEDDIRVLPEVLRSLGLKQIIVVTHSRELKEAGDVKFIVRKERGWTKVERVEEEYSS